MAVNLIDTTTIEGGVNQQINDWSLGDDRIFQGIVVGLDSVDPNLATVYFTFKTDPTLPDDECVFQIAITTVPQIQGVIKNLAPPQLALHVFSADYEDLVNSGQVYFWDFRGITEQGTTITIASGQVQFIPSVTQTNIAGSPAALPNGGNPRFRGFLPMHPKFIPGFYGIFNRGDWYRNKNAAPGCESGWVAITAGYDASIFRTDGIIGNT